MRSPRVVGLYAMWVLAVTALSGAAVNVLWDAHDDSQYSDPTAVAVILALAATLTLVLAPRWPMAVAAIATFAVLGLTIGEFSRWVASLGPCLALPWVARTVTIERWVPAAIAVLVVTLVALRQEPYIDGYVIATLLFFAPCAIAAGLVTVIRSRRAPTSG